MQAYPPFWICRKYSRSKEKHLIINYSNMHSFLKHCKDVYIETRRPLHRQPPFLLILHLHPLLTWVFSVGSLFHSRVERMFLLFAFLCHPCASLWRELRPCGDLASIPSVSLLRVTCPHAGKSFLMHHVLLAFPGVRFLWVAGIYSSLSNS